MSRNKHGPSTKIVFNNKTYYHYPLSPHSSSSKYFIANDGEGLHRAVWSAANGPIPPGHHIHHIDGNGLNNDLSNLELLERSEHLSEHWSADMREAARRRMPEVQKLSAAWHRSEEGRAFHRRQATKWNAERPLHDLTCEICGSGFKSKKANAKCCSQKCIARRRWAKKVDHVLGTCIRCGASYSRHKRQPTKGFCGRSCAVSASWERRKAAAS